MDAASINNYISHDENHLDLNMIILVHIKTNIESFHTLFPFKNDYCIADKKKRTTTVKDYKEWIDA